MADETTTDPARQQTDAFIALKQALVDYLGEDGNDLADWMVTQWSNNVSEAQIAREIRSTDAYKKRFPGMEHLSSIKQGISESEYIAAEREYRSAISTLGSTYQDFYSTDYIGRLMTNDVNPSEATQRVAAAQAYINGNAPRSVVEALRNQYGMTDGDMVAYMLDPENLGSKIVSEFETRQARAGILGAGAESGYAIDSQSADAIAARGYTYGTAAGKLANAREVSYTLSQLAAIEGGTFTDKEALDSEFALEGGVKASEKKKGLASKERARFSGSSGLGRDSLGSKGLGSG